MLFVHAVAVDPARSAELERDLGVLMHCREKRLECSARLFRPATLAGDQGLFSKGVLAVQGLGPGPEHRVFSLGPFGGLLHQPLLKKDESKAELFTGFHECAFQADPLALFADCGFAKKAEALAQRVSLFVSPHDPRLLVLSLKDFALQVCKEDKEEPLLLAHYVALLLRGREEEEPKTALREEYAEHLKHLAKFKAPDALKAIESCLSA